MHARSLLRCVVGTLSTRRQAPGQSFERRLRLSALLVSCQLEGSMPSGGQKAEPSGRTRKHVVTAVVQRSQDGRVLLVQRSEKVSTYKLQWGGISGGIEGSESAVHRCLQEIVEEVGFQDKQVAPVRSGRPLYVDDGRLHFAVHPFLFNLADNNAQVQLNWENVDWAWVSPQEIRAMDTVPLMPETVARVVVPSTLQGALERLEQDRTHGAAELATWVLDALKEAAQQLGRSGSPEEEGTDALDVLRNYAYHLATCRPSMAPLANAAAGVLSATHTELMSRADAFAVTRGEVCATLVKSVLREQEALAAAGLQLQGHARGLVREGMTIMTTSYSSSIAEPLCEAAKGGCKFRAIVCESRPLNEGVTLASALAGAGVECTVITDAQAGVFMQQADMVLVGADALIQDAVVNKVGTYLLALAAKAQGVPLYAVATTSKFAPGPVAGLAHPGGQSLAAGQEEKGTEEVTASWQATALPRVTVRNVYFEPTPLELFAGIVTEEGLLHPEQAAAQIERLREAYRVAFLLE